MTTQAPPATPPRLMPSEALARLKAGLSIWIENPDGTVYEENEPPVPGDDEASRFLMWLPYGTTHTHYYAENPKPEVAK
ncbi:MAG: hypothetical protein EBQ92_00875 [Proteobacteria bacterium]|nr:hypothetical protein [Pseudomonadota bacterium]